MGLSAFHRPRGGPPPSKREVFGVENRRFESCRRARDARPYNVAENCNCEMCLQRWVASLQRLDAFATDGFIVISRRGAHRAPVRPRRYNSNPSRGRAKGHRGDRKAPICNRRQGRKALTGEPLRPPSSREGDRPQAVEGVFSRRKAYSFPKLKYMRQNAEPCACFRRILLNFIFNSARSVNVPAFFGREHPPRTQEI